MDLQTIIAEMKANEPIPSPHEKENRAYNAGRTYDHLHNDIPIGMPELSDMEVGGMIRMMLRSDWYLESKVCVARDRIYCLVKEKQILEQRIKRLEVRIDNAL